MLLPDPCSIAPTLSRIERGESNWDAADMDDPEDHLGTRSDAASRTLEPLVRSRKLFIQP